MAAIATRPATSSSCMAPRDSSVSRTCCRGRRSSSTRSRPSRCATSPSSAPHALAPPRGAGLVSDLLLSTFISRRDAGRARRIGPEIVALDGSEPTMQILESGRANRLPYTWKDGNPPDGGERPRVRLPGGDELHARPAARRCARSRIGPELGASARRSTPLIVGAGWVGLAAAVYGVRKGLTRSSSREPRRAARPGLSLRIREPPRLSRRNQRHRAHQPRVTQAREVLHAYRDPVPRAVSPEPGQRQPTGAPRRRITRSQSTRCCSRAACSNCARLLSSSPTYEGMTAWTQPGTPEEQLCGASRVGGNRRGQLAGQARRLQGARRRAGRAAGSLCRPARDDVRLPRRRTPALRRGCS